MDVVILTEDYQTGTVVLDSTSSRTMCEDLEVRLGDGGKGLMQKVCWDDDILLSTGVMIVRMWEACPMGYGKLFTGGVSEVKTGD